MAEPHSVSDRPDEAESPRDLTNTRSSLSLRVNGQDHQLEIDNRTSLLDLCREHLALTGPKKGCDHGQCGACTMLLDGRRVNSCLVLAVMVDGADVTTIEGLAQGERLHPVQQAFLERDGYQCGYCTPGQICSAVAVLSEASAGWPSVVTDPVVAADDRAVVLDHGEVAERMSGNLCRCGAYANIVPAVLDAAHASTSGREMR